MKEEETWLEGSGKAIWRRQQLSWICLEKRSRTGPGRNEKRRGPLQETTFEPRRQNNQGVKAYFAQHLKIPEGEEWKKVLQTGPRSEKALRS